MQKIMKQNHLRFVTWWQLVVPFSEHIWGRLAAQEWSCRRDTLPGSSPFSIPVSEKDENSTRRLKRRLLKPVVVCACMQIVSASSSPRIWQHWWTCCGKANAATRPRGWQPSRASRTHCTPPPQSVSARRPARKQKCYGDGQKGLNAT